VILQEQRVVLAREIEEGKGGAVTGSDSNQQISNTTFFEEVK
jgi:hypothetical protein